MPVYYSSITEVRGLLSGFDSSDVPDAMVNKALSAATSAIDSCLSSAGFVVPFAAYTDSPATPDIIMTMAENYAAGYLIQGPLLYLCGGKEVPAQGKFYMAEYERLLACILESGKIPGLDTEDLPPTLGVVGSESTGRTGSRLKKFDPYRDTQKSGDNLPVADYDLGYSVGPRVGDSWL